MYCYVLALNHTGYLGHVRTCLAPVFEPAVLLEDGSLLGALHCPGAAREESGP